MKFTQEEIKRRHLFLIEKGYHTISKFARYYGVNILEEDVQFLDEKARTLCSQRNLSTGKEPEGTSMSDCYPYSVLVEIFEEFLNGNKN